MKKIILIVLLFLYYSNTYAIDTTITLWSNQTAWTDSEILDVAPHEFESINVWIYARGDFSANNEFVTLNIWSQIYNIDTNQDSDQFSLLYSNEIIANSWSILNISTIAENQINFAPWSMLNYYEVQIVISYTLITDTSNDTWSGSVIVNINNEWINKEVFDLVTIEEIYKYEALIMVFIVFYTFLMRVIWRRPKQTKPFDF